MKNILIPTDLTDCTLCTLKYSIWMGDKSQSKLFFYHQATEQTSDARFIENFIKKIYQELKLRFNPSLTEILLEQGEFSNDRIKKIITKKKIDLVIMGASHEGFRNTFFGSKVTELINEVSCPVLSFPHGCNNFNIERIGFASEIFDLTKRLKYIIPFAKLFNAGIDIVHIYPVFPQKVDIEKFNPDIMLDKLKTKFAFDKLSLQLIKTNFDNEVVSGIKEYISENHPDLLVMFHKPRGWFDKLAFDEGATPSMIKSSPVPILALSKKSVKKFL